MRLCGDRLPLERGGHPAARHGFTLIEIILAISLAVGLLMVAMWFYQQATRYRNELLQQAERLAAVRLLADQIAGDMRAVNADGRHAFTGDSNYVRFTKAVAPPATAAGFNSPGSDLRVVSYRTVVDSNGTNLVVTGIRRDEEPAIDWTESTRGTTSRSITTALDTEGTTNRVEKPSTDAIRHLAFRFWDGAMWKDTWNSFTPPAGLEVQLASEMISTESTNADSGTDIFRRVVVIPAGAMAVRSRASTSTPLQSEGGDAP